MQKPNLKELEKISYQFLKERKDLRGVDILSKWRLLLTQEEIQKTVEKLAIQLNQKFSDCEKEIVVVCILKGCIYYFVDLTRLLTFPFSTYFIEASSYRDSQKQEKIEILSKLVHSKFKNKQVILLDELYDNGTTLEFVKQQLISDENALGLTKEDIFTSTVFIKNRPKDFIHPHPLPNLIGINIPDLWVVGYGLDDKQEKRGWKHLYAIPKTDNVQKIPEDDIFKSDKDGISMYSKIRQYLLDQIQ